MFYKLILCNYLYNIFRFFRNQKFKMIQEIYVTEIKNSGIVTAIQGSLQSNYAPFLPKVGDNLFELNHVTTSNFFKQNKEKLFSIGSPCSFIQSIDGYQFQITVLCNKPNTSNICWQVIPQTETTPSRLVPHSIQLNESNSEKTIVISELQNSISLDFIDGMSLPIFELSILPNEKFSFEYANNEMMSLFPRIDIRDRNVDIRIVFSSLNYADKEYFIHSLSNIDSSKTWSCEFRIYVDNEIKWFIGAGHFSKIDESDSYTLRAYLKDISDKKKLSSHSALLEFSFRNAVTPIYYVNKDASFYDFNDAANNSLGYSRAELMSLKIHDFDPFYETEKWNEYWSWIKNNKTSTIQTIHRKKDGSLFDVLIVSNLIHYEEKELVCAYIFDLTEKNKLENEIKLADFSFKHLHTAIHILTKDGGIFKYNPAAQAILGYTEEDYKTLHIHDIDPFYNADKWPSHWEELKKEGRMTVNTINKKKDGTIIPVEIITNFILYEGNELVFSFFSDISQRVEEEERLRLLESVIVNTNDSVIITDTNIGDHLNPIIIYVNEAFTKLTGYTSEEVIGKNPRILQSGHTAENELNKMRHAIKNLESCEVELINKKKNGEIVWINAQINPVANKKGEVTHFIGVQRDITHQKMIEIEKEKILEELIAKNKKLRQFSYITTHNLRAPLTNLLSASRIIKGDTIRNPLTRTLVEIFKKSTLDLNDTLNTLLNALVIHDNQNVAVEKLSLSNMLEKVKSKNSHLIANTCCLITSDFSRINEVDFNVEYLESIFQNLIANAIKYSDPLKQPEIFIKSTVVDSNNIQLIFSDNGIGMDMNLIKDRIFGLNQRFHEHTDGKGIGLYLVHEQLAVLGGTITVTSEVNKGSKFYINFKRK